MKRTGIRIAITGCAAFAIALVCWFYLPRPRQDEKAIATAQDEVYETVVRDMIAPRGGRPSVSQLVFDDELVSSGAEGSTCEDEVKQYLRLDAFRPPYNSLADKLYRFVTRGGDDYSMRDETIRDFIQKYCTGAPHRRLSETFHTDLPRTFIAVNSVYFDLAPDEKNELKSFKQLFPGVGGIISFSRVGFDSSLDEAIVSTQFACGMLCGDGRIYVLHKRRGHWKVVMNWMIWVS